MTDDALPVTPREVTREYRRGVVDLLEIVRINGRIYSTTPPEMIERCGAGARDLVGIAEEPGPVTVTAGPTPEPSVPVSRLRAMLDNGPSMGFERQWLVRIIADAEGAEA